VETPQGLGEEICYDHIDGKGMDNLGSQERENVSNTQFLQSEDISV
jgi:hypothetical protein